MESFAGHFLVASPRLRDPNFAKTLVLLVDHDEEGAFGVVVNRAVGKTIQDLWREVGSAPCRSRRPIYLGGPVPGPLISLHTKAELSEMEPVPGVFLSAKKENLDRLVLDEESAYKVFVGHSGWGAGQLENELGQGAWRVLPATADNILSTADDLWETIFRQLGRSLLQSMLKVSDLPSDPSVN